MLRLFILMAGVFVFIIYNSVAGVLVWLFKRAAKFPACQKCRVKARQIAWDYLDVADTRGAGRKYRILRACNIVLATSCRKICFGNAVFQIQRVVTLPPKFTIKANTYLFPPPKIFVFPFWLWNWVSFSLTCEVHHRK